MMPISKAGLVALPGDGADAGISPGTSTDVCDFFTMGYELKKVSPHVKKPVSGVLCPPGCDRSPAQRVIFSSSKRKCSADWREGNSRGEK